MSAVEIQPTHQIHHIEYVWKDLFFEISVANDWGHGNTKAMIIAGLQLSCLLWISQAFPGHLITRILPTGLPSFQRFILMPGKYGRVSWLMMTDLDWKRVRFLKVV